MVHKSRKNRIKDDLGVFGHAEKVDDVVAEKAYVAAKGDIREFYSQYIGFYRLAHDVIHPGTFPSRWDIEVWFTKNAERMDGVMAGGGES